MRALWIAISSQRAMNHAFTWLRVKNFKILQILVRFWAFFKSCIAPLLTITIIFRMNCVFVVVLPIVQAYLHVGDVGELQLKKVVFGNICGNWRIYKLITARVLPLRVYVDRAPVTVIENTSSTGTIFNLKHLAVRRRPIRQLLPIMFGRVYWLIVSQSVKFRHIYFTVLINCVASIRLIQLLF